MRRADVFVLGIIGFVACALIVPGIVRMRQAAYGTKPHDLGMVNVDQSNFPAVIEQSKVPVVIIFYAGGFPEFEAPFWKEFVRRNRDLKIVAVDKNSGLWSGFNSGQNDSRAFLWFPGLKAMPLSLTGDMDFFEGQIRGMLDTIAPPRSRSDR